MKRAEIIARRGEFVIPGYEHKYKTLTDVGFDGDWVTPYQMTSHSETGPVLVAHYWLDAPSVHEHRDVLKEQGWLPSMPFNKVLTLALERAKLTRADIYVTQAFHLFPHEQWPPFPSRHIDESFERITRHEVVGRTVIALGTVAAGACRRAGVKAIECISPSARLSWEYKVEKLAEALKTAIGNSRKDHRGQTASSSGISREAQACIGKRERLAALARHRRDNVFPGYRGIGEYHSGAYECDFVSPYTKSAGNLDADIMLVLQDWCSDEFLRRQKRVDSDLVTLGHDPQLDTNKNLKSLLSTHFGIRLEQTYATNLFPFIKHGEMSARVPPVDLKKAAETYTVPEIEIIEPRLVVCLGFCVYQAICKSSGLAPADNLDMAIASPFWIGDAEVRAQSHPGGRGRANRGVDRIAEDWRRMADAVQWDVSRGRPKHGASRDA